MDSHAKTARLTFPIQIANHLAELKAAIARLERAEASRARNDPDFADDEGDGPLPNETRKKKINNGYRPRNPDKNKLQVD